MKKTVNLFEVAKQNTSKIRGGDSASSFQRDTLDLSSINSHIKTNRKENEHANEIGLSTLLDFSVSTVRYGKKVSQSQQNYKQCNDGRKKIDARLEI